MGSTYSVNGFINAALRRSGKTLLVEGITDKNAIHRICTELQCPGEYLIDHAGILSEADCSGLGNRQKVIKVREAVGDLISRFPRLDEVLAILIDREWDGLASGEKRLSDPWVSPDQDGKNFVTLGHSIENYYFSCEHVIEYLKLGFSDSLKPGIFHLIEEEFPNLLVMASCMSLAIQEAGLLSRSSGLLKYVHFDASGSVLRLNDEFAASFSERGVGSSVCDDIVNRTNSLVERYASILRSIGEVRWLPHGHLGEDAIWAGVAAYAASAGTDEGVCERIVGSGKNERQRFMAHLLGKSSPEEVYPLRSIVDWLVA